METALSVSDYCSLLYPLAPVTFAELIQNNPDISDKFLEIMCAEEMSLQLRSLGHITDALKRDICNRSRDKKDANSHLLMYLIEKADEGRVRKILEYASTMEGYGKMNAFAASLLEKLQ